MTLGEQLKQIRTSHNLSQSQFAKIAGVKPRAIGRFEVGENLPNIAVLLRLADHFGISLDYLTGRSDNPEVYGPSSITNKIFQLDDDSRDAVEATVDALLAKQ